MISNSGVSVLITDVSVTHSVDHFAHKLPGMAKWTSGGSRPLISVEAARASVLQWGGGGSVTKMIMTTNGSTTHKNSGEIVQQSENIHTFEGEKV